MIVKVIPRATVRAKPASAFSRDPSKRLWWAQVTVTPDDRRVTVLKRGTV